MLSVVILNVIMLSVIMLSVVAPSDLNIPPIHRTIKFYQLGHYSKIYKDLKFLSQL
jgi:hypothetical protein